MPLTAPACPLGVSVNIAAGGQVQRAGLRVIGQVGPAGAERASAGELRRDAGGQRRELVTVSGLAAFNMPRPAETLAVATKARLPTLAVPPVTVKRAMGLVVLRFNWPPGRRPRSRSLPAMRP